MSSIIKVYRVGVLITTMAEAFAPMFETGPYERKVVEFAKRIRALYVWSMEYTRVTCGNSHDTRKGQAKPLIVV